MIQCDIAIIGAGPYGLSAAAHLKATNGFSVRVFGEPMSFWDRNMPVGMLLRSNWTATRIADPNYALTLEAFQTAMGRSFSTPVPLDEFVQYGLWYQRQAVPDLDRRKVARLEVGSGGFQIVLDDGEPVEARRVVIAAGISSFAWRPPEFRGLSSDLASHTSEHRDLSRFSGKRVLVLGSGQSALESAALLHESGATVEVLGRSPGIHWLQGSLSKALHHGLGKITSRLLYAPTDVGPAGLSQLMARPDLLRHFPQRLLNRLRKRCVRPAGARWLLDRLQGVPIQLGCSVVAALPDGKRIKLRLGGGQEKVADHVLLGTGYRVDISKYDFISTGVMQAIQRVDGYPLLRPGFETSVPGLYILGAPAAWCFGPLLQFVSGTTYASMALVRSIARALAVRS